MAGSSGRFDRLLQGLLLWTALTTLVFWLPLVRGLFDGVTYQWGGFGFSGRGTDGDYWFVAGASAFRSGVGLTLLVPHVAAAGDEHHLLGDVLGVVADALQALECEHGV